jgi:hypothetical protein
MHLKAVILVGAIMAGCGCSTTHEHEIQRDLATRNRSLVRLALETLEEDRIISSQELEKINCDGPYSKARPQIRAVLERLRKLSEAELEGLDRSLSNKWYRASVSLGHLKWDSGEERKMWRLLGISSQGAANGRRPTRPENILESPAAASRRSP